MAGSDSDHIIQRLIFEVDIDSRDKVHRTHEEFSRLFRRMIVPMLEKILDEYNVPGHLIRIDKLELDLGHLDFATLEHDLKPAFERSLKHLLEETIPKITGQAISNPDSKNVMIPLTASDLEGIEYFLIHGRFPTRFVAGGRTPETILRDLAEDAPRELGEALRKAAKSSGQVAYRMVRQFSPSVYSLVFEILFPYQKTYLEEVETQLESVSRKLEPGYRSTFRLNWREVLFEYLLKNDGAFDQKEFGQHIQTELAKDWELPAGEFWKGDEEVGERIKPGGGIAARETEYEEFEDWLMEGKVSGAMADSDWYRKALSLYKQDPQRLREAFRPALQKPAAIQRWLESVPSSELLQSLRIFTPRYYKKAQLWFQEIREVFAAAPEGAGNQRKFEERLYRSIMDFGMKQRTGWEPERLGKSLKEDLQKMAGVPVVVSKEIDRLVQVERDDTGSEFTPEEKKYRSVYDPEPIDDAEPPAARQLEAAMREGAERLRRWVRQHRDPEKFAKALAEIPAATLKKAMEKIAPSSDRYVRELLRLLAKELPETAGSQAPGSSWVRDFYKDSLKYLADRNLSHRPEKFEKLVREGAKKWEGSPEKLPTTLDTLAKEKEGKKLWGDEEEKVEEEKRPWELPSREQRLEVLTTESEVEGQDLRQAQADLLEYFLREGAMPWWAEDQNNLELSSALENLGGEDPELIREILVSSFESQSGFAARQRLMERVLEAVEEEQLLEILETFEPGFAGLMGTVALGVKYYREQQVEEGETGVAGTGQNAWAPILQYVLEKGEASVSTDVLTRFVITRLAAEWGKPAPQVVRELRQISQEAIDRGEKRFFPIQNLMDQWIRQGESVVLTEEEKTAFTRTMADIQALDLAVPEANDEEVRFIREQQAQAQAEEKSLLERIRNELQDLGPEAFGYNLEEFEKRVEAEVPQGLGEVEEEVYRRMIVKRLLEGAVKERAAELFTERVEQLREQRQQDLERFREEIEQRRKEEEKSKAQAQSQSVESRPEIAEPAASPEEPKERGIESTQPESLTPEVHDPEKDRAGEKEASTSPKELDPSKEQKTDQPEQKTAEAGPEIKDKPEDQPLLPEEQDKKVQAGKESSAEKEGTQPVDEALSPEKEKASSKEELETELSPETSPKSLEVKESPTPAEEKGQSQAESSDVNESRGDLGAEEDTTALEEEDQTPRRDLTNEQLQKLPPAQRIRSLKVEAQLQVLNRYLNYGSLPPVLGAVSKPDFMRVVEELNRKAPKKVARLLRRNLNKGLVRSRVVKDIPKRIQEQWGDILSPQQGSKVREYSKVLDPVVQAGDSMISAGARAQHQLFYAAYNRESDFTPEGYIKDLLRFLGREEGKEYVKVLEWLDKKVEQSSVRQKTRLQKALSQLKEEAGKAPPPQLKSSRSYQSLWDAPPPPTLDKGDEVYIKNAGMVMLHPFLFTYFDMLEMLDSDRQFKSVEMQNRGVHLLQYVATKEEEAPEQELALNKLLVGLPLDFPVEYGVNLTEEEKYFSDSMLQKGVVDTWDLIKNSSPDGLRYTFFGREGRISFEKEKWFIRIEQKSFDLLLDKWPHSLGLFKLPWMEHFCQIEWR